MVNVARILDRLNIKDVYSPMCGLCTVYDINFDDVQFPNSDGNLYGMSAPSNQKLMEKINELVKEVNRLKKI